MRQTLAGLLVTRLSSTAIILDKLAAKMLQIGVFLAVGLPIACLLGLLGGIDGGRSFMRTAARSRRRFSWSLFHCWSRCHARGPRTAILLVYLIEPFWLFAPWVVDFVSVMGAAMVQDRRVLECLDLAGDTAIAGHPGDSRGLERPGLDRVVAGNADIDSPTRSDGRLDRPGSITVALGRMIGWQVACGAVLLFWASWRLRGRATARGRPAPADRSRLVTASLPRSPALRRRPHALERAHIARSCPGEGWSVVWFARIRPFDPVHS